MRFKIVLAGWNCRDWMEQTLQSIETQAVDNWDVWITYDPSDDAGGEFISAWCDARDERWNYTINTERKFAIRNHHESITKLDPADDDVVVFLDLDGDMLAHRHVLERLGDAYDVGALVTYGQYKPIPDEGTSSLAKPYPADVVVGNGYRRHHLRDGETCFNHLRTISGRVFKAIPLEMFKWQESGSASLPNGRFIYAKGDWYQGSTDYVYMISALELAGGRYKCFDEVLLLYNHANPLADNKTHPHEAHHCVRNFFARTPLAPLKVTVPDRPPARVLGKDPYLPPARRRSIMRDYGRRFGLRVFVETGTSTGDTPAALMGDFDVLYTIEVGAALYDAAMKRFRETNVVCFFGDSARVLPQVLAKIDQPALFWLDGHFCGDARADKDTPIIEELQAIFDTKVPHVILIDDARLFEGMSHFGEHDWPHVDDVKAMAAKHLYTYEVADDIIRLTP